MQSGIHRRVKSIAYGVRFSESQQLDRKELL